MFDFECLPSEPSALPGQNCDNTIGAVTCGDGQACVREMNQDQGVGICEAYCDPTMVGACSEGYGCVTVGVGLLPKSPLIHVCQVLGSDASIPIVGVDAGPGGPTGGDAAGMMDGPQSQRRFDAFP